MRHETRESSVYATRSVNYFSKPVETVSLTYDCLLEQSHLREEFIEQYPISVHFFFFTFFTYMFSFAFFFKLIFARIFVSVFFF